MTTHHVEENEGKRSCDSPDPIHKVNPKMFYMPSGWTWGWRIAVLQKGRRTASGKEEELASRIFGPDVT